MKKINVLLVLAAVLALSGVFTTCSKEANTTENVTVTFLDPLGENTFSPVSIEKGSSLGGSLPDETAFDKVPDGFPLFYGWFENNATQYFPNTQVGANITLTARWISDEETTTDLATITFAFTQTDGDSNIIMPRGGQIPPVKVIKGKSLGPARYPAALKAQGWTFNGWQKAGGADFTMNTTVDSNITVTARWIEKTVTYTVTFNSGTGGAPVDPIEVLADECIDEWVVRFPPKFTENTADERAFFVAWLDEENREYDGRVPITRDVELKARWGLPPYVVNFQTDISSVVCDSAAEYGNVDYKAKVREAWDSTPSSPKYVIVNEVTYDVPNNTNRWRILYRIALKNGLALDTGFYTRYTIRARFYANQQGAKSWTDSTAFTPNKPAAASGYSKDGLLHGVDHPSDNGWGQISWTGVSNWNGQGADADTMLQRYNLDMKGGTLNDTWAPLRYQEKAYPPYLLIQTSDAYIGHIEVTQIVFHNGEDKKYTEYEDELEDE